MPLDKSRPTRYNNTSLYITQCYYTRMVLMPAVRKVSKEQIIDAAVEVLRDDGFSAINARSVAKKLGCSTQPIYFSFKNMDELKAALTQRAIELHTQRVRDSLRAHEGSDSRYSSYGMGFVKFAAEEKQLFRWLYLEGEQPGAYQSDVLMQEVIGVIVDEFGYAEDVARRFHQDMIYFTYGLAILAKYDLTDIGNALSRVMDNPMTKIIRSGSIGVLGVVNPVAGIVGGIGNDLLSEYNTFKLGHLLNGLASGFNLERRLNELYNYVNSSPEKAIIVANLFKQTVNAECPKVCVIYGLILANHLETLTEFTHEELIVCKALENATDYDLKNFKEIMENYLKPTSNGRRIVFPKDFADIAAFTTTCDWCVYNRIFVSRTAEWGEMEEGILDMSTYYYEANPASVLLDNINAARQTWNYG